MDRLATSQGDWHGWTFRTAAPVGRGEAADRGELRLPRFSARRFARCAGRPIQSAQPLTAAPRGECDMYAMSHKILLVDDDAHIRQLLAFALGKAGMKTTEAEDGEAALKEVERDRPDLIVLDINMPRMDGLEVCRRLRAEGDLPILFLSSRDDEIDRVLGLELGGDDYVVKPFSPREVVARVSAILKRGGRALAEAGPKAALVHNRLRLDPEAWEAHWDDAPVPVTVTEFQLLHPARQPAFQGLHPRLDHRPAARPGLCDHRPDDRQPHPQPALQVRGPGRRRPDRDAGRDRLPDRPLRGPTA